MEPQGEIVTTVAIALIAATAAGYLVALLRLPTIVGFMLAGVALSPFTPGFSADRNVAGQLAEIGVILLMFGVGLQFSIKDLVTVQRIAVPGAILHTLALTTFVVAAMSFLDWSLGASIMLGLAVSNPSTVIVVKVLSERGKLDASHGRIAIGWAIVEDLIAVLILVLAPSLTTSEGSMVLGIGEAIVKVAILALLMLVVGRRMVPRLLEIVARTGSREVFIVTILTLALSVAYVSASLFDVSFALGAFLAGLVISESDLSHQVAADALPFQDAFAVLFFVSVGMLFDPDALIASPLPMLVILLALLLIKPILTFCSLVIFRVTARSSLELAAARAQMGEVSFVLASVGLGLDIFVQDDVNLIVAGAILSILILPLTFRATELLNTPLLAYAPVKWPKTDPPLQAQVSEDEPSNLRGHAVLLGYGRVGRLIGETLKRRGYPYIVVEFDRWMAEELRDQGVPVIFGDAANPIILERLNLPAARVLVVALPDRITTRLAIERAWEIAPDIRMVVRTHSEDEQREIQDFGADEVIFGERELAIEMARSTLRRFGVSALELRALIQGLRSRR